ncbi:DUF726 domain-containing protein [Flavobacterium frigidarium]|uniref:DUF726 domain-containing protein n=1 Tax=Flavobacterium frigidarium TaxID=99286 RepID=UPI00041BD9F0|nr:DUF726 domain-containing protein [Flavobacterium frigidarium]
MNQIQEKKQIRDIFLSSSIDKFKITKQRDGNYPAIITISGWRSQDKDNRKDWEESILKIYPDREWFHLEWNSEKIPFIDKALESNMPSINMETEKPNDYNKIFKRAFFLASLVVSPIVPLVTSSLLHTKLLNNYWHTAVRNSKQTGDNLAQVLNACKNKDFILVGHSLGARVIFNCLSYLSEKGLHSNIFEIHLLGGAVSSNPKKWSKTSLTVKNKIYNYYSDNDNVLKTAYRASMLSTEPIGLYEIENKKVINRNTTIYIDGHTEYIKNFSLIKNGWYR